MNRCFATIWAAEIVLSFQIENVLRPNVSGSKMAHPRWPIAAVPLFVFLRLTYLRENRTKTLHARG